MSAIGQKAAIPFNGKPARLAAPGGMRHDRAQSKIKPAQRGV
jgi:hypothetical protein